jgi:hypothetical protein
MTEQTRWLSLAGLLFAESARLSSVTNELLQHLFAAIGAWITGQISNTILLSHLGACQRRYAGPAGMTVTL